MGDHEIDGLGGDVLGRHDQVALVFAVFFVDQNNQPASAQLGDDFSYRGYVGPLAGVCGKDGSVAHGQP